MLEEKPKRRPRTPLSAEELHYFIKLKKLKQVQKIENFKRSVFYKVFNRINIFLSAMLTYFIFSILFTCCWQTEIIKKIASSTTGGFDTETRQLSITEIDFETQTGKRFIIKTDELYTEPEIGQEIYLGTDLIFNKYLKTKFSFDERIFWNFNTYPAFILCCFTLILGLFIYKINKHLSINGLLMVFGLYFLASLYFILV